MCKFSPYSKFEFSRQRMEIPPYFWIFAHFLKIVPFAHLKVARGKNSYAFVANLNFPAIELIFRPLVLMGKFF